VQAKIERQIGCPAMLGYGAKLNAAETEEGLLSSLVPLFFDFVFDNFIFIALIS